MKQYKGIATRILDALDNGKDPITWSEMDRDSIINTIARTIAIECVAGAEEKAFQDGLKCALLLAKLFKMGYTTVEEMAKSDTKQAKEVKELLERRRY